MAGWTWLRLATAVAGAAALVGAALLPVAAPGLAPVGTGLLFWSLDFPGSKRPPAAPAT